MKKNEIKKVSEVLSEMANNNENQVMSAVKDVVNEQNGNTESVQADETTNAESVTSEEVPNKPKKKSKKQTAESLQAEIERKTAELQACLAELERKKMLSAHRTQFLNALDSLQMAENRINEEDDFNSNLFKLKFTDASSYNGTEIFTVSNRFILLEFITFMRGRIGKKISELEMQLING